MPYSEPDYDYDTESFLKEQRDYQRYYNTPFELDGTWYASLSHYDMERQAKEMKLAKMTIELKLFIQEMVLTEMYRNMDREFPALKSK
jgi:predicted NAD-dependent protein-ADP-ribosyltransferase YbiA (DUF1768 family)